MKFFSAALAAFAVGSAMAAPVLDARTEPSPTPCPCGDKSGKPGLNLPAVNLPDCTTLTTSVVKATALPVPVTLPGKTSPTHGDGHPSDGHHDNSDVIVVVHTVVETVIEVEAKVKAHLALIGMSPHRTTFPTGVL
jgi:hypothetical protein